MIYGLIFTHWIADFICQTDDMAKNKSKSNYWLLKHIIAYMGIIMIFALCEWGFYSYKPLAFVWINGAAHFVIDYATSRISSKLWAKGQVHNFFVCIGFDQALHMATLYGTYQWLMAQ